MGQVHRKTRLQRHRLAVCRRTAEDCENLIAQGLGDPVREKTGLLIDAYFSATKIRWILNHVPEARRKAERGELLFGTVDSWLIWNLTGGRVHVTDYSNASRTMLFDIEKLAWDSDLCQALDIPEQILPEPVPNSRLYGRVDSAFRPEYLTALEGIPICGSAGDQPAALFGQGCLRPGDMKNTYGTGCFTLMNTGNTPVRSGHGLLSSVAWCTDADPVYALEGSVFNGGSTIQWIRDELGIISSSHECDILAGQVEDSGGVFVVPAFTGLGAPYWDMYARGTVLGLTRGSIKSISPGPCWKASLIRWRTSSQPWRPMPAAVITAPVITTAAATTAAVPAHPVCLPSCGPTAAPASAI